jgi:hypothetical protein
MSRFSAVQSDVNTAPTTGPTDEVLFKPDRPRHIDRFIDYFGTTETAEPAPQHGGAFLSTFGDDE